MPVSTHALIGRFALKWMGCGVFAEEVTATFTLISPHLSLPCRPLICSSAMKRLLRLSDRDEEVALEKKYTDDNLQSPLRIIKRSNDGFSLKFWTETATHLIVDVRSNTYIEDPDCEVLNPVLVEEDMHRDPTKPDTQFLPHHPFQSPTRCPRTNICIPTITRYITALVAQIQWLDENDYSSLIGYGPESDVVVQIVTL